MEADGVIMLHASDASRTASQVIICSPDTDVTVLAIHFCRAIGCELWIKTGSGVKKRYLSVNTTAATLGVDLAQRILPFHALTGCDSVSYFSGKGRGKGEAWKTFSKSHAKYQELKQIGDETIPNGDVETNAASFICQLYNKSKSVQAGSDLNALRYKLFTQPGKENLLPPTQDCFHQHFLRANYTCYLWKPL